MAGLMVLAMIAPAMSEDAETSATIGNEAPYVCIKWEEPDDDNTTLGTQVMPEAYPNVKPVTIKACVCDPNGPEEDIDDDTGVTATVTGPAGFTSVDVALIRHPETDEDCPVCSCGLQCIQFDGTFNMGPCDPAGNYTVVVTVTDLSGATDTEENTFEYLSLIAMTAGNVAFGSVASGGSSNASSTVNCTGNTAIVFADLGATNYDNPDDADGISWTNMTSAEDNSILDDQITTTWNSTDTITCGSTGVVPFRLDVPPGTPSGTYMGTVVFTPLV